MSITVLEAIAAAVELLGQLAADHKAGKVSQNEVLARIDKMRAAFADDDVAAATIEDARFPR